MNVVRMENSKVKPVRGRARGRGRDYLYWKTVIDKPIINTSHQPKYQTSSSDTPRHLLDVMPSSSSCIRTPSSVRRIQGMPSSSSARIRSSASTNLQRTSSTCDTLDSTVIMAITSGRGDARSEVGMAAIDIKFPHLILSQISDTQTYANTLMMIHYFNPVEILMPETMCGDDPRNKLYSTIKNKFKEIQITSIWRPHFNEENGLDRVKKHRADEYSSIELFVKEKYYALAATAALLKYVEQIQQIIYEPKSMKIEFQASQGSTLIDIESAINLELVSSQGPQKHHNLFSSLDRCVTPMGRKLLRSSILQPLCDQDVILERQACVSELVRNRNLHTTIQPIVKQLFGADRLLGLSTRTALTYECVEVAERNLNYVLILKTCLDVIPQLVSALEAASSPTLVKIRENLKDPRFQNMKEQILEIVQMEARAVNGYTSANVQRCFALKSSISDILDIARQTYCELTEQTTNLVESLAREFSLPLSVACNATLGYHIQMQVPKHPDFKITDLPCVFIEVQKKRNKLYMTTSILMSLSQQCKTVRNNIHIMSSCLLEALISNLRNQVACLFQLSEDIAELDLVMSIARISGIPDFVKPTFGQNLRIIDSKHPIVDLLGSELPRPNDIEASISYNFCNITGPNMSGKSTFLKQVVLLHIMAQIGCYLPAKEATLRVADRIFCRLCPTYEDIESDASSFIQEIREVDYILKFVTPNSLIVLDEICRSTNSEEGAPIAFTICENLLQTTAFIFNCTHFLFLTKLTELYPNAVNYFLVCEPNELDKWGLKYTYKLRKGITSVENYGISAASACRLPKPVIEKSKQLVCEIAQDFKPVPLAKAPKLSWQKDCYDCVSKIMNLIISEKYTLENVQDAVDPLRGHKNLKIPVKENNLLSNVLQKNFQRSAPDNLLRIVNITESQQGINVLQKNPEISSVQNSIRNSEKFDTRNVDDLKNAVLSSNDDKKSRESSRQNVDVNQSDLISSDLSQYPFHYKTSNDSCPKESFYKNVFKQKEDNFQFKVPAAISPSIKNQRSHKSKHENRGLPKTPDLCRFLYKKKTSPYLKNVKNLIDPRNKTLYEFGFSKKVVYDKEFEKGCDKGFDKGCDKGFDTGFDKGIKKGFDKGINKGFDKGINKGFDKGCNKGYDKGCSYKQDIQDFMNEDETRSLSESLKLQNPDNNLDERASSDVSFYSTRSRTNSEFNQDQTSRQEFNFSNPSTPKKLIQRERVTDSPETPFSAENGYRSPSNYLSNNSRNSFFEGEVESRSNTFIKEVQLMDESQLQEQILSNSNFSSTLNQREDESRSSIFERSDDTFEKSEDIFEKRGQFDQDNISKRSSSPKRSSFSRCSRNSFEKDIESRSSSLLKKIDGSGFQEPNLSMLSSPGSFKRSVEPGNIFRKNEHLFKENEHLFKENGHLFKKSEDFFNENKNVFNKNENIFNENKNVFNKNENIFNKNENVFNKNENSFNSNDDIFNENSFNKNVDTFNNNKHQNDYVVNKKENMFEKELQFVQKISRKSPSQNLSPFSNQSRNAFEQEINSSFIKSINDSIKPQLQKQNISSSPGSFQRKFEPRNIFKKGEEISMRSQSQSPVNLLRKDDSRKSQILTPNSLLTKDDVSRRRHLLTPESLLKEQDNISRRSQFQSPKSLRSQHLDPNCLQELTSSRASKANENLLNFNSSNSISRKLDFPSSFFKNSLQDQSSIAKSTFGTSRSPNFMPQTAKTSFGSQISRSPNFGHQTSRTPSFKQTPKLNSKSQYPSCSKSNQYKNKSSLNINTQPFSVPRKLEFRSSLFENPAQEKPKAFLKSEINAWQPYEMKSLQNLSSIPEKDNFEGVLPKKLKLDIRLENEDVSLNLMRDVVEETLSSLNSANFSFVLDTSPLRRSTFHSQNSQSLFGSQSRSSIQKSNLMTNQKPALISNARSDLMHRASQKLGFMTGRTDLMSRGIEKSDLTLKTMEKPELKKESDCFKNEKGDTISLGSSSITISEFESVLDEDTIEIDDVSEFPSPKQKLEEIDVFSISSVDTIEAADNVRKKEEAIFREIEENAVDEEMFLQRIFNSPLSAPCSDELCTCSNLSTLNELSN